MPASEPVKKLDYIKVLPLIAFLLTAGFSQEPIRPGDRPEMKGKIRSISSERIYVVYGGRNVGELRFRTAYSEYDENNEQSLYVVFGEKGQKVVRYIRDKNGLKIEVTYLDKYGKASPTLSDSFTANFNAPGESGLCSICSVQEKEDPIGNVDRILEVCPDGSKRAEEVFENGLKGELIRYFRSDALGRSWEGITDNDENLNP